jgi:hypothetical protein
MAIDPDIKRLSESRKTAVAVSEQMPGIIVAFVPDLVHFCNGGIRAPAILNNIGVIEMRVSGKKSIPHNPAPASQSLAKSSASLS